MQWALANPVKVFAATIVGVAATIWVTSRLPKEILPQVDDFKRAYEEIVRF